MQPILIMRMKKLIAICCDCKLHFSLSILQPALVAQFIDDRTSHPAAVYFAIPGFYAVSDEGGAVDPRLV